jgi:general stress protein YciG
VARAVPDSKRSFSQNRDLAAQAGRKGGQSVPGEKRSFSQNRELAAQAGRKGGQSVPDEKRSFSQNPGLAAEAGRKGGQASHSGLPHDHDALPAATNVVNRRPGGAS